MSGATNIYKRGKTWWGRVTIDGVEYRQSLKTTSRERAAKVVEEWVESIRLELSGAAATRTFDEMATHFLLEHVPTLKPQAGDRYRQSLRFLIKTFEGVRLDKINAQSLNSFVKQRQRDGVKPPTIRRDLACLSSLIDVFLTDHDLEHDNPTKRFMRRERRRGRLRESEPRRRYLSHEEEARLLVTAKAREAKDHRLRGFADELAIAIDTGLRLEEQYSLTWSNVDLRRKTVRVTWEDAKSNRSRDVPLLDRSAQILAQFPRRIRQAGDSDFVFVKPNGERRHDRDSAFATTCKLAGIQDLRWHDLRRTCGCRLKQDHKKSFDEVRDWLGHASVSTTERAYAFLRVDDLRVDESAQTSAQDLRTDVGKPR